MKPIISITDYNTLSALIADCPPHLKTNEMGRLAEELNKAEKVEDHIISNDVIQLNSRFEVEELSSKKVWKMELTLPQNANLKEGKLSVFSPLGVALIGFQKGMTIEWELPGGRKTIKIKDVINS